MKKIAIMIIMFAVFTQAFAENGAIPSGNIHFEPGTNFLHISAFSRVLVNLEDLFERKPEFEIIPSVIIQRFHENNKQDIYLTNYYRSSIKIMRTIEGSSYEESIKQIAVITLGDSVDNGIYASRDAYREIVAEFLELSAKLAERSYQPVSVHNIRPNSGDLSFLDELAEIQGVMIYLCIDSSNSSKRDAEAMDSIYNTILNKLEPVLINWSEEESEGILKFPFSGTWKITENPHIDGSVSSGYLVINNIDSKIFHGSFEWYAQNFSRYVERNNFIGSYTPETREVRFRVSSGYILIAELAPNGVDLINGYEMNGNGSVFGVWDAQLIE